MTPASVSMPCLSASPLRGQTRPTWPGGSSRWMRGRDRGPLAGGERQRLGRVQVGARRGVRTVARQRARTGDLDRSSPRARPRLGQPLQRDIEMMRLVRPGRTRASAATSIAPNFCVRRRSAPLCGRQALTAAGHERGAPLLEAAQTCRRQRLATLPGRILGLVVARERGRVLAQHAQRCRSSMTSWCRPTCARFRSADHLPEGGVRLEIARSTSAIQARNDESWWASRSVQRRRRARCAPSRASARLWLARTRATRVLSSRSRTLRDGRTAGRTSSACRARRSRPWPRRWASPPTAASSSTAGSTASARGRSRR